MENFDKDILIKFITDTCSEQEKASVEQWLAQSAHNRKLFDDFVKLWNTSSEFEKVFRNVDVEQEAWKFIEQIHSREKDKLHQELQSSNKRVFPLWIKVAAVLLVIINMGALTFYGLRKSPDHQDGITEFVVPYGARSRVKLPDGTAVWLNSGSRLQYSSTYNQKEREISLEGEAFFSVAKNKNRPFIVKASGLKIQALGTEFNVKSYAGEGILETTLVSGRVSIVKDKDKSNAAIIYLKPSEKLTYVKKTGTLYTSFENTGKNNQALPKVRLKRDSLFVKPIDPEPFVAWKDNRLVFRNESLAEMVVKMERWFDIKIVIKDKSLLESHFTGTIENETFLDVLRILSDTMPIEYTIDHRTVFINKK